MKKPKKWQVWKYRTYIDYLEGEVQSRQDILMREFVDSDHLVKELNADNQRFFSKNVDLEKENKRLCDEVRSLKGDNTELQRKINET